MITIILPAYNVAEYIEECVASIPEKYPIIMGVDGCVKTLEVAKTIKRDNLRIYWCPENGGCSLMRNTLLDIVETDTLLFDGDDIMYPELPVIAQRASEMGYDIVQWKYDMIMNGEIKIRPNARDFASGVLFISQKAKTVLGGYRNFRCSADSELLRRAHFSDLRIGRVDKRLMAYRVHPNNLTNTTPMSVRLDYHKQFKTKEYGKHEIYVERQINAGEFVS